jgi:hypothetical protein
MGCFAALSRNRFERRYLVMHAIVRDDQPKSRETLPLRSTSRPKNNVDHRRDARHGACLFGQGSQIQQPHALDHDALWRDQDRGLTDAIEAMITILHNEPKFFELFMAYLLTRNSRGFRAIDQLSVGH